MKIKYQNGSVFLVPLDIGGFARGVVAQSSPRGRLILGYFFGPRIEEKCSDCILGLNPKDSVLLIRFGDMGLRNGTWPIIGSLPQWNQNDWPKFNAVRRDPLGVGRSILVEYDDTDPAKIMRETFLEYDNKELPDDGLAGHGFVEKKLSIILANLAAA